VIRLNAYGLMALLAVGLVGCGDDDGGPVCGDGVVDVGEQCDDMNNIDGDGCSSTCQSETAQTAEFVVPCCVGGDPAACSPDATLDLPVALTIDPGAAGFSSGAAATYTASIDSTLAQNVTMLILSTLMTDQVTIDSFDFSLTVTGGTPADPMFTATNTPVLVDIDANNDGTSEAAVLGSGAIDGSLMQDGVSSDVVFEFAGMSVTVLLPDGMGGSTPLPIEVPTAVMGLVNCALPVLADTQLTFPVN